MSVSCQQRRTGNYGDIHAGTITERVGIRTYGANATRHRAKRLTQLPLA
jgi:hypothetical protein